MKWKILLLVFVTLLSLSVVMAGHVSCGDTIYSDTVLDSDLLDCSNDGLIIGVDDITLNCNGHTIKGSNTNTGEGISIFNRQNVEVRNCNVQDFGGNGIILSGTSNNNITNNIASNSGYGIYLESSSSNTLTNNIANSNNNRGISLYYSSNNTLTNNIASNNDYGIYLYVSSNNNILTNNTANSNNYGIVLSSSSYNTLNGNTANSNTYGIYFYVGASSNILINSEASLNNQYGIRLYSSSNNNILTGNTLSSNNNGLNISLSNNNLIYNNFFENINNAFDDGFNSWNTTKTKETNIVGGPVIGGNFWSDYDGQDTNGDGIGDTNIPYNSTGNIQNGGDFLPLVERKVRTILFSPALEGRSALLQKAISSIKWWFVIALIIVLVFVILFMKNKSKSKSKDKNLNNRAFKHYKK